MAKHRLATASSARPPPSPTAPGLPKGLPKELPKARPGPGPPPAPPAQHPADPGRAGMEGAETTLTAGPLGAGPCGHSASTAAGPRGRGPDSRSSAAGETVPGPAAAPAPALALAPGRLHFSPASERRTAEGGRPPLTPPAETAPRRTSSLSLSPSRRPGPAPPCGAAGTPVSSRGGATTTPSAPRASGSEVAAGDYNTQHAPGRHTPPAAETARKARPALGVKATFTNKTGRRRFIT